MEPSSDPRLEAAIDGVAAWRGRDLGITPLSEGPDERHVIVESGQDLHVLRLASASSPRRGDDLSIEVEIARSAATAGVAPEVVACLPHLGCIVTRLAPGRRLVPDDGNVEHVRTSIVGSLRALHACPPPARERSPFREAGELRRAAHGAGVSMPSSERAATEAMRCIERISTAEAAPPVTCHGDLTTSSAFLDGEHVWIVDYRWAARGDAFEDLGSIAAHLDLDEPASDSLLGLYFGRVTDEARSRLALMRMTAEYLAAMRALSRTDVEPDAAAAEERLARVVAAAEARARAT